MVQVLPYVPGFGERLAPVLAQAGSNLGQGFAQRRAQNLDQNILNQLTNTPNASPMEMIKAYSRLSPGTQQSISPLVQQLLKSQSKQQEITQQTQAKAAEKKVEQEQESAGLKDSLDWLDQNISYTGTTVIPGYDSFTAGGLRRETVGKRAEYDAIGFWATDKVFTHFNKGTVSKEKLNTIKKDLSPRADLSERENKARINALRRMSNLPSDTSPTEFNKQLAKEVKDAKSGKVKNEGDFKVWVVSPSGQKVHIPSDQLQAALANGGTLP